MIIFVIFLLLLGSPKASRILLLYEKAEMQLVSLFEEAKSSEFQITKGKIRIVFITSKCTLPIEIEKINLFVMF